MFTNSPTRKERELVDQDIRSHRSERYNMHLAKVLLAVFMKLICVENRELPQNYLTKAVPLQQSETTPKNPIFSYEVPSDRTVTGDEYDEGKLSIKDKEEEGYSYDLNKDILFQEHKEPCAIVVLSNIQSPSMQSLLRKYKYDANGVLIPSSVQYFMKIPREGYETPTLVPFNDKSFSHLGGYVRYYKEVPPIPQSW